MINRIRKIANNQQHFEERKTLFRQTHTAAMNLYSFFATAITSIATSFGIIAGLALFGVPIDKNWNLYIFIAVTLFLIGPWIISNKVRIFFIEAFRYTLIFLYNTILSIILFFAGNFLINRKLEKISTDLVQWSEAQRTSQLFARLIEFNHREPFGIAFSHNAGDGEPHPEVGYGKEFRITGFPVDEAELVMRIWYFIDSQSSSRGDIWPQCSCAYDKDHRRQSIANNSMTIIGSPKYNKFCDEVISKFIEMEDSFIFDRERRYSFEKDSDNIYFLRDLRSKNVLMPDPTPSDDELYDYLKHPRVLDDYALIMKIPNIIGESSMIDNNQVILVLAGCRVGGQVGLTQWFLNDQSRLSL